MVDNRILKNPVVKGTFILTMAGVLTKFIGFYYRIFLSNLIGARQLGIYQLIFPVYIFAISLCCQGLQAALTKSVSAFCASGRQRQMKKSFWVVFVISLFLSLLVSALIYIYAKPIGTYIIRNAETVDCIRVICFGLPFVAIKSAIHGYCLGVQNSRVLGLSQLIEQIFRVAGTWLVAVSLVSSDGYTAVIAAYGIVIGEMVSCIYSALEMRGHFKKMTADCGHPQCSDTSKKQSGRRQKDTHTQKITHTGATAMLLKDGVLLTSNRVSMTLLSSFEAILIPTMLTVFYKDSDYCLELFGVLTGMAMPFITLPSTLTNALSAMLLPAVSETKAKKQENTLSAMTAGSLHFCALIGIFSSILFIIFGKDLGTVVFGNELAGEFIFMMAFLCPFIYISSTLSSILNGLDKTALNLFYHLLGITIRICFILFAVPAVGIQGYMWGLLASYLVLTMLLLTTINKEISFSFDCCKSILAPAILASISGALVYIAYTYLTKITSLPRLMLLFFLIAVYGLFYFTVTLFKDFILKS